MNKQMVKKANSGKKRTENKNTQVSTYTEQNPIILGNKLSSFILIDTCFGILFFVCIVFVILISLSHSIVYFSVETCVS